MECVEWFRKREKFEFVVEKMIHPEVDRELNLVTPFRSVVWDPIMKLPNLYYPQLVKEFYANMENKKDKNIMVIQTRVKGRDIYLDEAILTTLLDVPNVGLNLESRGHFCW